MSQNLYSAAQSRALDHAAQRDIPIDGYALMRRAGEAAFALLCQRWPSAHCVVVMCGGGNNGGDGWVLAELAHRAGLPVAVVTCVDPATLRGEAAQAFAEAQHAGVDWHAFEDWQPLAADVVVDALLGTGFSGEIRANLRPAIEWMQRCGIDIFALDIPSGVIADADDENDCAVQAACTLAFIAWKPAHWTGAGRTKCGELHLAQLGVPESLYASVEHRASLLSLSGLAPLPARSVAAHKGHFGHVVAVGGDHGAGGAIVLAACAAQRSGAGLVSAVTRPAHVAGLLARAPEVMARGVDVAALVEDLLTPKHTLLIGPGLGQQPWGQGLLQRVLRAQLPTVLDADALNLVAAWGVQKLRDLPCCVISPHPGEAARMLGCSVTEVERNRLGAARQLHQSTGAVVILKGAGTVVDDGSQVSICSHGNPGMASGGMGDVLSGIIAALLAQGLPAGEAARRSVAVHSAAADQLVQREGEIGLAAADLIPRVRKLLNE